MAWMNTSREPTTPPPLGLGTTPPTQLGAGMDAQLAATNGTPQLGLGSVPPLERTPQQASPGTGAMYSPNDRAANPFEYTGPPITMPNQPNPADNPFGSVPPYTGPPITMPPQPNPAENPYVGETPPGPTYTGPRNPQQATPGTGAMLPTEDAAWFDAELAAGRSPWLTLSDDPAAMAAQWAALDAKQQQLYTDVYGRQNQEAQAMWRQAFGYVEPPAPGPPQAPGSPSGGGGPTQGGQVPGGPAQSGPGAPVGRRGSPSAAMAESRIAGQAPPESYQVPGTNEWTDASPNNYTGQYSHEAAWEEPAHRMRDGSWRYAPGYGAGVDPGRPEQTFTTQGGQTSTVPAQPGGGPGGVIKWDEGTGPTPGSGYTMAGQQDMNSPLMAGDQNFGSLKKFIKHMMTSSPGQFDIKQRMEGMDQEGGSLETGEKSLFDVFSPYMEKGSTKIPMNGTPFNDWDPTSLLTLLLKSGILQRPT